MKDTLSKKVEPYQKKENHIRTISGCVDIVLPNKKGTLTDHFRTRKKKAPSSTIFYFNCQIITVVSAQTNDMTKKVSGIQPQRKHSVNTAPRSALVRLQTVNSENRIQKTLRIVLRLYRPAVLPGLRAKTKQNQMNRLTRIISSYVKLEEERFQLEHKTDYATLLKASNGERYENR